METTIDKLLRLRAILSDPASWWKGDNGFGPNGQRCLVWHAEEVNLVDRRLIRDAIRRLFPDRTWSNGSIGPFNDHSDTTHADVTIVIDAALAAAGYDIPIASKAGAETLAGTGA